MKLSIASGIIALTVFAASLNAAVTFTVSPSAVSNTYVGTITLQVSGLPAGDTVVVQKYLDINSDGVIDAPDYLVQQFTLTDGQPGMVIGGVTNINVPGDTDNAANGTIVAHWNYPDLNFVQSVAGQYIYRVSSPAGHFTAVNAPFTVTNFPYAQKITGTVVSNGVPMANAIVIVFPPPRGGNHGPGTPLGGTVANSSGVYAMPLPVGSYVPMGFGTNFVANYSGSPLVTLNSGQTIVTNLPVTNITARISGRLVDANNSNVGLPGVFLPAIASGLIGVAFSDTNGDFDMGVQSGSWGISGDAAGSLEILGYLGYDGSTNVNAGASGLIFPFQKGTALFYGTVTDPSGNPLPGVAIGSSDNGTFREDGLSDTNGNYVALALGGVNNDTWNVQEDYGGPANYLYSQGQYGITLGSSQAYHYNFTGILATNYITGHVQYNGASVVGVQVYAYANIGGNNYQSQVDTDTNGNYSLNVANGTWTVNVYDCGCSDSDSLNNILSGGNYQDPPAQNITIANNNGVANFTILTNGASAGQIFGYVRDASANPVVGVNVYASDGVGDNYSSTTDGSGYYSFNVVNNSYTVSVDCGQLNTLGYQCPGNDYVTISSDSVEADFTVQTSALQITTTSLPNGTNGTFYSVTFQATGGNPPYKWLVPSFSAPLPANLTLSTNGDLSGTPSVSAGTYYFDVIVTDAASHTNEADGLALTIVNPPLPPLIITNLSLPNGTLGAGYSAQLGATGGQPPYSWALALGSANPPPGLTLNSSGLISGTPTKSGSYSFKVQATDMNSTTTNKVLGIIINPQPSLGLPAWRTNRFQAWLTGVSNQNYTLQVSTNLSTTNWVTLYVTNNAATNSFLLTDPNATNKQRFYRILVGP